MRIEILFNYKRLLPIRLGGLFLACLIALAIGSLVQAAPLIQSNSDGQEIFEQKCVACHTIGGGQRVGPDLQDVTGRRDLAWLEGFIAAPDEVIASGDPIATELLAEYNNVVMPNLGLSAAELDALLVYLENPGDVSDQPAPSLPPGSSAQGENLFNGAQPLTNGGTSCLACHNVAGIAALGGGSLGPDLTHVYSRFGANGLQSALTTLPFPTMQGIFADKPLTESEQADLFAFFESADGQTATSTTTAPLWFMIIGGLGTLALFAVMFNFWPRQRQSLAENLREKA
ncbi:MAG: c-type cytochrome [Anaerolineales bacterium]|nr:c-type cytochrome [Anaerolineales bacterium]